MLHDPPVCTNNHDSGSLPELRISGQVWRGSSLGPAKNKRRIFKSVKRKSYP